MMRLGLCSTLLLLISILGSGCETGGASDTDPAGAPSAARDLPPLVLKESRDLLLTWVDEQGDFHVVQQIAQVPEHARGRVRVVITTLEAGTGDLVYVADLRTKQADGGYPTQTMTRTEWEEIGASRRKSRIEALAPSAVPSAPASAASPGQVEVVLYGAEWCGACRQAERYLRDRGVPVTRQDIEKNPLAQAELERKLTQANLPRTAQIPIIDIGGQLLVGFAPGAVDRALRAAQGHAPL